MKKIICKKEYDTETATLLKKYVCGGENSPYPTEDILRLAKTKVNDWMETH